MLPEAVHQRIRADLDHSPSIIPLLELGHRRPEFCQIAERSEELLRGLLNISKDYHILFLAGGATAQYAMVPMNLGRGQLTADYVNTGYWSSKAIEEAKHLGTVNLVAQLTQDHAGNWGLPKKRQWSNSQDADYCHFVDNETLTGFELPVNAVTSTAPLVADMTSNFLTRQFDMNQFGLVYAGTQKNLGIAGLCVVIVRDDLLNRGCGFIPSLQNYARQTKAQSRHNTPPIFSWYVCNLMLEWTQQQGGVSVMQALHQQQAEILYQTIDNSDIYTNNIALQYRSKVNLHFTITPSALERSFLDKAEEQGLIGLKGHGFVGGIRASLYNAMPMEGATTLLDFMREFEKNT